MCARARGNGEFILSIDVYKTQVNKMISFKITVIITTINFLTCCVASITYCPLSSYFIYYVKWGQRYLLLISFPTTPSTYLLWYPLLSCHYILLSVFLIPASHYVPSCGFVMKIPCSPSCIVFSSSFYVPNSLRYFLIFLHTWPLINTLMYSFLNLSLLATTFTSFLTTISLPCTFFF